MTEKNKLVPKAFRQISGELLDRLMQQSQSSSVNKTPALNAKVKKTYLSPRFSA